MSDINYVLKVEQELADKQEEVERLDKYCNEIIVGYDKEIERLNTLVAHQQKLEGKAITKEYEQGEEIERLKEVIKKALETVVHCSIDPAAIATRNILQQALKEG